MLGMEEALRQAARAAGKEHLLDLECVENPGVMDTEVDARTSRYESFVARLPALYGDMTFGTWRENSTLTESVTTVQAWAEFYPSVDAGLFIYSKRSGTGKTHLAIAAGQVLASKGYRVTLIDVVAFLERIKAGFDDKQPRVIVEDVARYTDVLILDDLGAEKATAWVDEQFYLLINAAIASKVTLIVTSNLTYKELAGRISERVVSRIVGATDGIVMGDSDYRREQHKERLQ